MKKKNLLLLLALILIPVNAKAAEMRITCDKTSASPKTDVNCTVVAYDTEVSGAEGKVVITNGTVKSARKEHCTIGDADTTGFVCADDIQSNSIAVVTYTIEVGESGTTTFGLNEAKVVGNDFATIQSTVTPVNITINSASSVDPTPTTPATPEAPSNPEPTAPTSTEPSKSETPASVNPVAPVDEIKGEVKEDNEKIENPETGSFVFLPGLIMGIAIALLAIFGVAKKKKFFRV